MATVVALVLAMAPMGPVGMVASEEVDDCTSILEPGTYELNQSITTATNDACFEIEASNVVLDGQDNTIDMTGSGDAVYVTSSGSITNVTIQNLNVEGGGNGTVVDARGEDVTVDVTFDSNSVNNSTDGLSYFADGDMTDVRFDIFDSEMTNISDDGLDINTDGNHSTVSVSLSETTISAENDSIDDITADGVDTIVDIRLEGNTLRSETEDAIEDISADHENQTADVVLTGNSITAANEGIDDIEVDHNGTDATVSLTANTISSESGDAIQDIIADEDNQTADIAVVDNVLSGEDDGIEDIEVDGDFSVGTVLVQNNTITSETNDAIGDVTANDDNQTVTIDIVDNDFTADEDGIEDIEIDGDFTDATVSVRNNIISSATDNAIGTVDANEDNQTATIEIIDNDLSADEDGIEELDLDGDNSTVSVQVARNSITSGDNGLGYINYGEDQDLSVEIRDNDIQATDNGIDEIWGDGGSTISMAMVNNSIATEGNGIQYLLLDEENLTVDLEIRDNSFEVGDIGIGEFDLSGSNETVNVLVTGNSINGFSTYGIEFDDVQLRDAIEFNVHVTGNHIASTETTASGILIDQDTGTGPPAGELRIDHSEILVGGSAIEVATGPVEGIEIHNNHLAGGEYGVENLNVTDGTYVDATDNYWNASDGPGSEGPYEDPVTGTLANGSGSNVTNSTLTLANVHFDSYRTTEPAPEFAVTITGTNSPIDEGDSLRVDAAISNRDAGANSTTQTVELRVGGEVRDSRELTLGAGESQSVSLTWSTDSGDAGDYTAQVESGTDSDQASVQVESDSSVGGGGGGGPVATVGITDWSIEPTEIEAGQTVNATTTLTNERATSRPVTVELVRDGEIVANETVVLQGGETHNLTIAYTFTEPGTYQFGFNGEETVSIQVSEAPTEEPMTPTSPDGPTDTATPTSTPMPSDSPTETEQPGFGVTLAVIALLVAALIAVRRRQFD